MSVSVRHDSSFREEIGFIILHYKYSENMGMAKEISMNFKGIIKMGHSECPIFLIIHLIIPLPA